MQFRALYAIAFLSLLSTMGSASPLTGPEPAAKGELATRSPWWHMPYWGWGKDKECECEKEEEKGGKGGNGVEIPTVSNDQTNKCSTGTPFCCSPENSGNTCVKANVDCSQTVICCNNYDGICAGDIDFNIPVTIITNIDIDF